MAPHGLLVAFRQLRDQHRIERRRDQRGEAAGWGGVSEAGRTGGGGSTNKRKSKGRIVGGKYIK